MTGALPPRRPVLFLLAAFLLPNLGALACGFVLDDQPLIVDNPNVHSVHGLGALWRSGYWPDRGGLTLYRPLTQTLWTLLWTVGHGTPFVFHLANLVLGAAVVLLAWRFLETLVEPATAFTAALLFALFPIHTEAVTSVVGSAELLAALFGVAALLAFRTGRAGLAPFLFAAAVFSKESAAAIAAVALVLLYIESPRPKPWRRIALAGLVAGAVIGGALLLRSRLAAGPAFVPAVDNPMSLLDPARRVMTALWVQVLYAARTLVPVTLSADYSYKEIPLVMSPGDPRAWAGLLLAGGAVFLFRRRTAARAGILLWAIPFLPASNILFPIGTVMGERLAYLPSLGLALLVAPALLGAAASARRSAPVLVALALAFGARTAVRNLDWRNADVFYPRLVETSSASAKAWYFLGALHSSRARDELAISAYDEAIAIFPAYSEAYQNRGNALARLGRREEAMESYRLCLRFDPGHAGAARNLATLAAGLPLDPPRRKL